MTDLLPILHLAFFAVLIAAMYTDVSTRRVPNAISIGGLVAGVVSNAFAAPSVAGGVLHSVTGAVAGFALFYLLYSAGAVGAGNVKVMAAVGSIAGLHFTLNVVAAAVVLGAPCLLARFVWFRAMRATYLESEERALVDPAVQPHRWILTIDRAIEVATIVSLPLAGFAAFWLLDGQFGVPS